MIRPARDTFRKPAACILCVLVVVLFQYAWVDAAPVPSLLPYVKAQSNEQLASWGHHGSSRSLLSQQPAPRSPFIIIFKEETSIAKLKLLCTASAAVSRAGLQSTGLARHCHMPDVCTRIYTKSIRGIAGLFSNEQLQQLLLCFPGEIAYKEPDMLVSKTEGPLLRHQAAVSPAAIPADLLCKQTHEGRRLLFKAPSTAHQVAEEANGSETSIEPRDLPEGPLPLLSLPQAGQAQAPAGVKAQQLVRAQWNIDRIDQRDLPLNHQYNFGTASSAGTGRGVTIYGLDSGVRASHHEFASWNGTYQRARTGIDFVKGPIVDGDCDGHGTHVASTALGKNVGVAKEATLVEVRVLDCTGSGTVSDVVAGLDWVVANLAMPAVVTLSLGISVGNWSRSLEDATRSAILDHNITVVVASGNSDVDACYVAPANVPQTITVAASDLPTKFNVTLDGDPETVYQWANTGPCVDLFAPGVDIYGACGSQGRCTNLTDTAYTWASGTSMAVPHVAGLAAIYLADNQNATPAEVANAIIGATTAGKLTLSGTQAGTPNKLIYTNLPQIDQQVSAQNGPSSG